MSTTTLANGTTLTNPVILAGDTLEEPAGSEIYLQGTLADSGTYVLNAMDGYVATLFLQSSTVAFTGGGVILLTDNNYNQIRNAGGNSQILINSDTIEGAGQIGEGGYGSSNIAMTNTSAGVIDATGVTYALLLQPGGEYDIAGQEYDLLNQGLIEATGSGGLVIGEAATIVQDGGTLLASGAGDNVTVAGNSDIVGGPLLGEGGGLIVIASGTLDGSEGSAITIGTSTTVQLADSNYLALLGTIDNLGTLFDDSAGNGTNLIVSSATVSLTGGGFLLLSDQSSNLIRNANSGESLINVNNKIEGAGEIGDGRDWALTNASAGVIDATGTAALLIDPLGQAVLNEGLMEATGTGGLVITAVIDQSGGTLLASGAGDNVTITGSSSDIVGGELLGEGGGSFVAAAGATLDGSEGTAITIGPSTAVQVAASNDLYLLGTIDNRGMLAEDPTGGNFILNNPTVSLTGGGTVLLSNGNSDQIYSSNATDDVLVNVDNTIAGAGQLGINRALALTNETAGVIDADVTGNSLAIQIGGQVLVNEGLLEAAGGASLLVLGPGEYNSDVVTNGVTGTIAAYDSSLVQFSNNAYLENDSGGALTGGVYAAYATISSAALQISGGGSLSVDAADIIMSGAGAEISFWNGNAYQAIESSLTEVTGTGTLAIIDGKNYHSANILTIDAGGVLDLASGTLAAAGLDFAPGPASLLVINAASELTGAVSGGGGTLGLAADSATGSFSTAMQSQFSNFGAIQIDAGAVWDFTGNFTLGAGTALLNNGTLAETGADALTISGAVTGAGLIILDPTTVTLNGSVAAGQDVSFANAGDVLSLGDPSQFNANITGFTVGDTIELAGVGFTGTGGAYGAAGEDTYTVATAGTLSIDADGTFYDLLIAGATIGQDNFILDGDLAITEAACFAAGTRIRTAGGVPRRVEALAVGDKIALLSGATAPVIWIGRRTLDLRRHPRPQAVQPVLITAGALGRGLPCRDLLVSPDHAMYLDGHLIPAKALLNGFSIRQLNRKRITYYHIELARHAVLFAEDAPAESYLETGNRAAFENAGPAIVLHPDFAQTLREAKGCAPFAESGPVVEAVRQRILDRAAIATTADPALQIRYEKGAAIIASRAAIPGEIFADPRDRRRLGVKIASLRVDGRDIPLDHPNLTEGWHDREPDGRWTDGRAKIPLGLLGGSKNLQVSLAAALRYPTDGGRHTKRVGRAV